MKNVPLSLYCPSNRFKRKPLIWTAKMYGHRSTISRALLTALSNDHLESNEHSARPTKLLFLCRAQQTLHQQYKEKSQFPGQRTGCKPGSSSSRAKRSFRVNEASRVSGTKWNGTIAKVIGIECIDRGAVQGTGSIYWWYGLREDEMKWKPFRINWLCSSSERRSSSYSALRSNPWSSARIYSYICSNTSNPKTLIGSGRWTKSSDICI